MTDSPPESAAARAGRLALAVLLSLPLFLWRCLRKLWLVARAVWARRRERSACRRLGVRMDLVNMGDEYLREQIAAARRGAGDESQKDRRSAHKTDLERGLMSLGKSGAAAGVPVMGAEAEYRRYHATADAAIAAAEARAAATVFPPMAAGWLVLFGGVATVALAIYLIAVLV